ncbi:MAG: hypothetical protein ACK53Y_28165 [bacterium]
MMSEGGGIAATNSGVVETANDSTLKPWLLPNVSVENRKSDEDEGDNMSLESGEEQQQQGVHDDSSDDDDSASTKSGSKSKFDPMEFVKDEEYCLDTAAHILLKGLNNIE